MRRINAADFGAVQTATDAQPTVSQSGGPGATSGRRKVFPGNLVDGTQSAQRFRRRSERRGRNSRDWNIFRDLQSPPSGQIESSLFCGCQRLLAAHQRGALDAEVVDESHSGRHSEKNRCSTGRSSHASARPRLQLNKARLTGSAGTTTGSALSSVTMSSSINIPAGSQEMAIEGTKRPLSCLLAGFWT